MEREVKGEVENIVIIGSGPSAWTCAIYAGRAGLKPLVFAGSGRSQRGGQLTTSSEVENFPGFPLGISGGEIVRLMEEQAMRFETSVINENVDMVDFSKKVFIVNGVKTSVKARSVVVATGADAKKLDIPGSESFWGRGVSACATCDGPMPVFRGKEVAVVGGGDTACEEALFLTNFVSKVHLIHRRDELRASKIMRDRVMGNDKIDIHFDRIMDEIVGEGVVSGVSLSNPKTGQQEMLPVAGLFYAIGHLPNSQFLQGQLELNENGYIVTKGDGTTYSSVEGVFIAGDVCDHVYRQAVTAAASGCMAAIDAERWLKNNYMNLGVDDYVVEKGRHEKNL